MGKTALKIALAALLVRLAYIFLFKQLPVGADSLEYDRIALNLLSGHGFSIIPGVPTPVRPPLYPYFLSFIYRVSGHNFFVVRCLQAALSAANCALVYLSGRKIFGEKIGRLAAAAMVFYPADIAYTGMILTESLFTCLLGLSVFLFVEALDSRRYYLFCACGLALGVTTLCRPTTILFPVGTFLFMLVREPRDYARVLLRWTLLTVFFAAAIAPWTFRNYERFGTFLPVASGGSLAFRWTAHMAAGGTFNDGVALVVKGMQEYCEPNTLPPGTIHPRIMLDRKFSKETREIIKNNFPGYLKLVAGRLPGFWITSHSSAFGIDRPADEYLAEKDFIPLAARALLLLLQATIIILALAGILMTARNWRWTLLPFSMLFYFTGHITFDPCQRYHVPVMPYAMMFAAAAVARLAELRKERTV
jgi:4-amino-4-deoxy-L-arabinose transferase-like glycosyltransferase